MILLKDFIYKVKHSFNSCYTEKIPHSANNATLLNNTITCCHLDAMQIKQQCLVRVQHCKNVEAMQIRYLIVVLVHFLIVVHIFCEGVLN